MARQLVRRRAEPRGGDWRAGESAVGEGLRCRTARTPKGGWVAERRGNAGTGLVGLVPARHDQVRTRMTTRRFWARPCAVSFGAAGRSSP